MAEQAKKKRRVKSVETVRERATKGSEEKRPRRIRRVADTNAKANKADGRLPKREFHLPLPDNKFGRLFSKRVRFKPKFFREAWTEVRQVTWPSRKETFKLSMAVFIFAIVFGGLIWLTDYGLDILFKKVLID